MDDTTDAMVVPVGIPAPTTVIPAARPVVLARVTAVVPEVVAPEPTVTQGASKFSVRPVPVAVAF